MTPILETTRLCRSFPGFALKDIDLTVASGSILGLLGPSGAGKTTLLKLIMGQIRPNCGQVMVAGMSLPQDLKKIRCKIGYVGEDPPFLPRKRVQEIVNFASPYYPGWNPGRFNDLLKDFDIHPEQRIESLSRGRKTLLSLAFALSHEADLLLLDEPTAGLDAIRRRRILRLLAEFVVEGRRSVVITTHQTNGLDALADQMAFLHGGRLLLVEPTDDLLAAWKWLVYRDGALNAELENQLVSRENGAFGNRGLIRNFPEIESDLESGRTAGDIQVANATIDDILVSLTEGE